MTDDDCCEVTLDVVPAAEVWLSAGVLEVWIDGVTAPEVGCRSVPLTDRVQRPDVAVVVVPDVTFDVLPRPPLSAAAGESRLNADNWAL